MTKNGFTLVELLAIIVVLGLIGILTVPAVGRIIRDNKNKASSANIDTILDAAYDYVQQCHLYGREDDGEKVNPYKDCCGDGKNCLPKMQQLAVSEKIKYGDLVNAGLIKADMTNPNTGEYYDNNSKIKITYYTEAPNPIPANSKIFGNYLFTFIN